MENVSFLVFVDILRKYTETLFTYCYTHGSTTNNLNIRRFNYVKFSFGKNRPQKTEGSTPPSVARDSSEDLRSPI